MATGWQFALAHVGRGLGCVGLPYCQAIPSLVDVLSGLPPKSKEKQTLSMVTIRAMVSRQPIIAGLLCMLDATTKLTSITQTMVVEEYPSVNDGSRSSCF
jgi:hypothetical protein